MIYCVLISCDKNFEPKKPTDVPERGQVLMIYPWTGAKAAAEALATNKHRIKYGSKHTWENVWMVLYVADEKPKQGDFLDFIRFASEGRQRGEEWIINYRKTGCRVRYCYVSHTVERV